MKPMNTIVISWQPPEGADAITEASNVAEFFRNEREKIQALLQMEASPHCDRVEDQHPLIGTVAKHGKYHGTRASVEVRFCNECMPLTDTVRLLRQILASVLEANDLPDLKLELNNVDVEDLMAGRLSGVRVGQA